MALSMPEAVIVDCLRTAVGKAPRGALRNTRPDDMAAAVFRALLARHPAIPADEIEDVILGCAMPEAEAGLNMARAAALRAGLPVTTTGVTINRYCSSGLQSIAMAADRIRSGGAQTIIAGGSETMSMIPMAGNKPAPNPWLTDHYPEVYMNMGLTAEEVQRRWKISREDADAFSLRSHQNALHAQAHGHFLDEIVPLKVETTTIEGDPGKPAHSETTFDRDEGPRADTSLEVLAKLKPVFHATGNGDRRQFVADQRRRGGRDRDVGQARQGTRTHASRPLRQFRYRRSSIRDHGRRAGCRDTEGAGARRAQAR